MAVVQTTDETAKGLGEYLFLLELFVHRVTGERLGKLNRMFLVPTRVCFKMLDLEDDDITVTPVDPMFEPRAGVAAEDVEDFNSGRSVMFAIAADSVRKRNLKFTIKLEVAKKMPKDTKPEDIVVGSGELDMSNHLAALRREILRCGDIPEQCPPRVFEGNVRLFFQDKPAGEISIYARISGFGRSIVTEIEKPLAERASRTCVFKSLKKYERQLVYDCRVANERTIGKEDRRGPSERRTDEGSLPIQSSRGPPKPCGKPVLLELSGVLDVGDNRHRPTVTVAGESGSADPERDVFVLRIGKKGLVGPADKSDIQLEMRTPKGPERGSPIRYETREMQTDEERKGNQRGKTSAKRRKKKNK